MLPFALTIAYVLTASLLIALTMVPAASSFLFKNYIPRRNNWFETLQTKYARSLAFFLRHKALPLVVSVVLLVVAVIGVVNMGITMIPTMTSKTATVTVTMPEDTDKETAYATAGNITRNHRSRRRSVHSANEFHSVDAHGFVHNLIRRSVRCLLGGDVLLGHLAEHYVAWRYFHRYWHAGR